MDVGDLGGDASAGAAGAMSGGSGGTGGTSATSGAGGTSGGPAGTGATGGAGSGGNDSTPVVCSGVTCAMGQDCCYTDGKCFDTASPTACPAPPDDNDPQGRKTCSADSQCGPGYLCAGDNLFLCLGNGHCESRSSCATGTSYGICGCNGVSYFSFAAACAAGVRLSTVQSACGPIVTKPDGGPSGGGNVTYCGNDTQCPAGAQCCAITGRCYDPAKPGLCAFPPPGTRLPCVDDSDCPSDTFCDGPSCSGPGGCKSISGPCNGELLPVCGCDGKNYMNAKCANTASKRVRHEGYCSDADTP
jgi:hypothetical protein